MEIANEIDEWNFMLIGVLGMFNVAVLAVTMFDVTFNAIKVLV